MASNRITVRIPERLGERLRQRSRIQGRPESALIRQALEGYLRDSPSSRPAYELAQEAKLIGCIGRGNVANPKKLPPRDLSTNARHFEGFGSR